MKKLFIATIALLAVSCIDPIALTPDIAGAITAFEVEGQTRSTVNAATRTVTIEVAESANLAALTVRRLELVATATSDVKQGDVIDLTNPLKVTVTTAARYEWTISATRAHDPQRPLPGGSFDEWSSTGNRPTWNPWPAATTGANPADGEWERTRWWDTGNKGVNLIAASNSTPTEEGEGSPANPSGRAARLESRWVAGLKVAGGNIYFGRFGKLTGLDATCDIGHPWRSKPKSLRGWYRYFPQPIDHAMPAYLPLHPSGFTQDQWLGTIDSLHINIALWASPDGVDKPFTVNTDPRNGGANFVDFQRDTPGVIAYGSFVSGDEQAEWAEFDLPLKYYSDGPLPDNTYLFLQVTSSKNCNYFVAGTSGGGADGTTGSLLYVDEFSLTY